MPPPQIHTGSYSRHLGRKGNNAGELPVTIQQRCCQGRMAFSCSQRQIVLWLMRATRPERCAWRATSATLSRDSGRPKFAGNSQASALISTVSPGGESPGATPAGSLFQARQSLLEEAFAP